MNKCKNIVRQYPIILNCIQSGILMGAGDGISQLYIEKTELGNYNYKRTARFAFMGCFVVVSYLFNNNSTMKLICL